MPLLYLWYTGTFAAIFQHRNLIQRIGFTVTQSPKQCISSPLLSLAKTCSHPMLSFSLTKRKGKNSCAAPGRCFSDRSSQENRALQLFFFFRWSFGLMLSIMPASFVTHRLHVSCASSDFLLTLLVLSTVTVCWFSTTGLITEIGC